MTSIIDEKLNDLKDPVKVLTDALDVIGKDIKKIEDFLRGIPGLEVELSIKTETRTHNLMWKDKRIILAVNNVSLRPLIEHKAQIRINAAPYLEEFLDVALLNIIDMGKE